MKGEPALAEEKIPILLDTDIGTDIDDALCLAYLLRQPRCELLGITTVTGEPEKRAMLADALCLAAGRDDIPIRVGAAEPLLIPQAQAAAQQAEVLPRLAHREYGPGNEAVSFLRQVIRARPGEITLLTIGPLTNIGLLFALDPEIPRMLRRMVMMAGVFTDRLPGVGPLEWNARGDAHATAIVYDRLRGDNLSVGLDVTCRCRLAADEARDRLRGGILATVGMMAEVWLRENGCITFHDPLAAAAVFEPGLLGEEDGRVQVELSAQDLLGMTRWTPGRGGPHHVALEVDPGRFMQHYFSVTGA
ncbi:MAG: nucleoside hydrolase [Patescibacteria group bacterium]